MSVTMTKLAGLAMAARRPVVRPLFFSVLLLVASTVASSNVKIMSYNIRCPCDGGDNAWDARAYRVAQLIRNYNPDFVGLQEAHSYQVDYLVNSLSGYCKIGRGREADGSGETSNIIYRCDLWNLDNAQTGTFQLSETPEVWGSKTWGFNWPRICTWGRFTHKTSGKALYHYNTHYGFGYGQEKASDLIISRIAGRAHGGEQVFVTGDLNTGEGTTPVMKYLNQGFQDSWRVIHSSGDPGTFGGFGYPSGGKIDYVFNSQGTNVVDARIIRDQVDGHYPSDHAAVLGEFTVGGGTPPPAPTTTTTSTTTTTTTTAPPPPPTTTTTTTTTTTPAPPPPSTTTTSTTTTAAPSTTNSLPPPSSSTSTPAETEAPTAEPTTVGTEVTYPAFEHDIDYFGNDVGDAPGAPESCNGHCEALPGCSAWTWTNYMGGHCWLKSSDSGRVSAPGAISGMPWLPPAPTTAIAVTTEPATEPTTTMAPETTTSAPPTTSSPPTTTTTTTTTMPPPTTTTVTMVTETDVDYFGNDVSSVGGSAESCPSFCHGTPGCQAWTWTDYMGGVCWLKTSDAGRTSYIGAVSGMIGV